MKELEGDNRERRVRITDKSLGKELFPFEMNYQVFLFVGVQCQDVIVIFN